MVDFADPATVGYTLLSLGVLLFLLEATMPGFFVGVPATVLVMLGVFALVTTDFDLFTKWAPLLVVLVGVPALIVTITMYRRMAPPDKAPTTQSADSLVGMTGHVTVAVTRENMRGKVKIQHQSWSATTEGEPIPIDARIRVVRVDGIALVVTHEETPGA